MDAIESRYRRIAADFILIARRSRSPVTTNMYLGLAGYYGMLARFHAKQKNRPSMTEDGLQGQRSPAPAARSP
jgi:hypothetical protein